MPQRRHKSDTKTFEELTFQEQGNSIKASLMNLQRSIEHHAAHSPDPTATRQRDILQVARFLNRIIERTYSE